ncbi:hypothetical protein JG687_00015973 [Phytophthora cactorum]|uniref:Uncharacterized protein n=1 Tax=Phytophthora cactorum TaxID=29920 RepID=A0A8T1TTI1_9STRA|nr:hypothetical protein GQ600_24904 [Phytophthora cactorum]KAG6947640.1 hypothetical protein JG687_00015973 [Phytophthora cactorum]
MTLTEALQRDLDKTKPNSPIFVERVTGLKLFVASQHSSKLAEGNANRVEIVTKVDDVDDDTGVPVALNSQGTEETDSEGTVPEPKEKNKVLDIDNTATKCVGGNIQGVPSPDKTNNIETEGLTCEGTLPKLMEKRKAPSGDVVHEGAFGNTDGTPLHGTTKSKASKQPKRQ